MLNVGDDLDSAYYIRLEPLNNRLVFDSWPRKKCPIYPYYISYTPFWLELERPVELIPGKSYKLRVFIEDTICEVYLNDEVAMSTRIYDLRDGRWGVFVKEGAAEFSDIKVSTI